MNPNSSAALRFGQRTTLAGEPGRDLPSLSTFELPNGCLVVVNNAGLGVPDLFVLVKGDNVTVPDGINIIAPSNGPGRWFRYSFLHGGSAAPLERRDTLLVPSANYSNFEFLSAATDNFYRGSEMVVRVDTQVVHVYGRIALLTPPGAVLVGAIYQAAQGLSGGVGVPGPPQPAALIGAFTATVPGLFGLSFGVPLLPLAQPLRSGKCYVLWGTPDAIPSLVMVTHRTLFTEVENANLGPIVTIPAGKPPLNFITGMLTTMPLPVLFDPTNLAPTPPESISETPLDRNSLILRVGA